MKVVLKIYFLAFSSRHFQNFIIVHEQKKQFLCEKNDIVLLFTSHGTGLAPKTWEMLSSVQNETH